ncbi:nicotinate-nucleotide--dimethylbenzimidazole phosphoribosyltransferase [Streptomyces canus]|uniref:nicotinate-nucleotide--dimethylbenzimidazole phosphoribosyltransferase n=1 Tax=Streptomyces canus TaxID=58343 RepID=UPI0022589A37|nr:nicotinate-nucleotide--dimethylbenzimidazole phosphoribosyltransferase [Streptomyces canus]MCX4861776.1 nicotinate-nucleotide--dimethylbenzimidazole phosphoribosyltransferase [Streptomyces canus]WSW33089.1 nicotinate-nucleotide--dimethylbenzimidazole phosphoribosyltransferase [Streptomyces canus]
MTDTGQVPGEGLPENAGMVEQPGVPGAYTYLSETTAEDEDLLLLPGAQSPWGNEVAPPAPEPVVETVHEPGPHEMSGRDSGVHDLSAVRTPQLQAPSTPIPPITPRRPLHLGPPIPDASASPVRSLADRGPAGAPVRQPAAAMPGPEYFDAPQPQGAVPWGAPAPAAVQTPVSTVAPAAETVVPVQEPVGAAQTALAPLASEAEAAGYEAAEAPVPDAVPGPEAGYAPEPVQTPLAEPGQILADGSGADGVQPDGAEGQVPGDGSLPDAVQLAPAGAETPAEQFLADGPVVEAVPDSGADAGQAPDSGPVVGVTEDAVAVPDPVDAAEAEPVPAPEAVPVVEASAAAVDADATTPVAEEVVAEPEAVAVQEAVASEAVPAEDAETGTVQEADTAQEAVVAPEAEAAVEEAAPLVDEAAFAATPEAAEDVTLQAPVEAEQAPQPADAVIAPDEVPSAPAEDDPAAEVPEPLAVEEAAPAPEPIHEPVPAALPAEAPQAHDLVPPAPQGPVGGPADASAQEAPEPLAADVADADVQAMDPTAPADEVRPSDPVVLEEFPAAPDQAPQGPQTPAAQPLPAELADAQTQFAYPAPAEAPAVLPAGVPLEPRPGEPLGEFVPVDGSVPTTPHLAPTPPLPTEDAQQPVVPAPREAGGDPELAQQADDLDTRAADQEDQELREVQEEVSTAPVEEVRQSTGPAAPAYDDAEREAVLKVMRERRDIRNGFRSDPIPHEVLLRVLEAAHTAPSVGHSQPWDFVVIRSAETRAAMQDLAQRQREAYAKSLPKGRAKQFKELKIEAILETPVNIVVTADPTRGGRHTLGRHTQPQMAPYSAALAVENLWLAARAEGLGVGWVSFFDEREMVRALGLPEHLEVIAYLCVGYVDEFPDEPELMQAGWSKRRPLSWVVHEETYGRRALPGEEPHDLLGETVAQIRPLDAKALGEAWERQKRMTKPAGALGMLEIISAQLCGLSRQCPPPIPEPAAVAIFAGDHGVHAQGVTPWPQEVTAQMVANFLGGGAVCNAFAAQVGAEVCVVDVGVASELPATPGLLPRKVRAGTSDMTTGPAMTREEAKQAIEVGIETARDLVAAGNKALLTGEMGIANTTASAALISVFTGTDPADVTGRGTGINDETLARKTEVVRRAIELHQPDLADPIGVLAAIGGFEHAAMVGLLLGGASLRTPVILDGVSAGAAALVARAIAPEVLAACIAGHRSAEPGHVAALNKLGLRPLVDLDLRLGEGTGALLALPLVQSTARAMHEVATFDSAGVTEK